MLVEVKLSERVPEKDAVTSAFANITPFAILVPIVAVNPEVEVSDDVTEDVTVRVIPPLSLHATLLQEAVASVQLNTVSSGSSHLNL